MVDVDVKGEIAKEHEVGDEMGIARTGFVLEEASILAPVVADFASGPMIADRLEPTVRGHGIGFSAGEVIGVFPGGRLLFSFGEPSHVDDRANVREQDVEWIASLQGDASSGVAAVGFLAEVKRGEAPAVREAAQSRTVLRLSLI